MSKLIYVDVETTGLNKLNAGIIQLAFIVEIDGEVKDQGQFFINPLSYKRKIVVSPKALEVNGHKEEDFADYGNAAIACRDLVAILNKYIDRWDKRDKFKFVGFNSNFDTGFVQELFTDSGYDSYGQYFDYRDIDVFGLVKYLHHLELFNTGYSQSLIAACEAAGIELEAHDALNDIIATRALHFYLIDKFIVKGK